MQSLNGDGLSLEGPEKGTGFPGTRVTGRCGLAVHGSQVYQESSRWARPRSHLYTSSMWILRLELEPCPAWLWDPLTPASARRAPWETHPQTMTTGLRDSGQTPLSSLTHTQWSSLSLSFCVRALWHFINALPAVCNHNRSHTAWSRNYMIHVWVSMLTPVPRMTNFHTWTLNDDNWPLKAQVIPGDQGKTFKDSPAGTTIWLKDHEKLTTLRRFIFSKKLSRTSWILKSLLAEETEAGAAPGSPGKFHLVQSYTLEFVTGWHWWRPRHCCFYFVRKVMVPSGFPHVANWLWLGVSSLSLTHVIKTWEESWRLIISSWKRKHIPRVIGLWPKYSVNNSSWNNSSNLK